VLKIIVQGVINFKKMLAVTGEFSYIGKDFAALIYLLFGTKSAVGKAGPPSA
jgi:hypothetical protein